MKSLKFVIFLLLFAFMADAQLPVEDIFKQAYLKGTRDNSGKPGRNYWQNTAKYDLKINFNPTTRLVSGTVEIEYINKSPDHLKEIWFKLYPNLYKKGTVHKSKIDERDLGEGVSITSFVVNNTPKALNTLVVEGTNMHTEVPEIASGKSIKLKIEYHYILNKGSHIRTGEVDAGAHFIAYFFPRIAVYDDIDGWNKIPYSGAEEFYNDFCDFKAAITVPTDYTVWATGDLTNSTAVFEKNISEKLQLAEKSDETIDVIDSVDLAQNKVTQQKPFNTFKFSAKNVVFT